MSSKAFHGFKDATHLIQKHRDWEMDEIYSFFQKKKKTENKNHEEGRRCHVWNRTVRKN